MTYQIKIGIFEGPFDLLLHLISKREIEIYQVSISEITEEYLSYLERMRDLDLEIATEFLLMAATLIKLKSDSLLPAPPPESVDVPPHDTRQELVWRLVEYKKFKNVAAELAGRLQLEDRFYYREVELEEPYQSIMPDLLKHLALDDLVAAARDLTSIMQEVDVSHIAPIRINVRDYVDRLMGILREREEISFVEFTRECSNKLEVIVSFLAMLELYKWELVDVKQAIRFGDILISRKKDLVKEDLGEYYQDFYAHM